MQTQHEHSVIVLDGRRYRVPNVESDEVDSKVNDKRKKSPNKKPDRADNNRRKDESSGRDRKVQVLYEEKEPEKSDSSWDYNSEEDDDLFAIFAGGQHNDEADEPVKNDVKIVVNENKELIEKNEVFVECALGKQDLKGNKIQQQNPTQKVKQESTEDPHTNTQAKEQHSPKKSPTKKTKTEKSPQKSPSKPSIEKPTDQPPNYFIHFPFYSSPAFLKKADVFRKKVLDLSYDYEKYMWNDKYHMSLFVMHLDEDQIPLVQSILENLGETIKDILYQFAHPKTKAIKLEVNGLKYFPYKGNKKLLPNPMKTPANVAYADPNLKNPCFEGIKQCVH